MNSGVNQPGGGDRIVMDQLRERLMSNNVGKDLVLQVDGFGGVISLNVNNGEIEGVYGRDPTAASSSYSITVELNKSTKTTLTAKGNTFELKFQKVDNTGEGGGQEQPVFPMRRSHQNTRMPKVHGQARQPQLQVQDVVNNWLLNGPPSAAGKLGAQISNQSAASGQQEFNASSIVVPGAFPQVRKWKDLLVAMSRLQNPELRSVCPFQLVNEDCPEACGNYFAQNCPLFLRDDRCNIGCCEYAHFRRACNRSLINTQKCLQVHMRTPYQPTLFVHANDKDLPDYLLMDKAVKCFLKD